MYNQPQQAGEIMSKVIYNYYGEDGKDISNR